MKSVRVHIGVLAVVAALVAGACSTSDAASDPELASIESTSSTEASTASGSDSSTSEVDQEEAFALFEACMADYGVMASVGAGGADVPGEVSDDRQTEPVTPEKIEEAQRECDPILEEAFGSFDLDPEQEAEMADQMLALQLCLADEGYDIEINGNMFDPGQVDMEEFGAALDRCGQEVDLGSVTGSDS